MSIALSEFWKRLVHVGITDASGCREIAAAYSRAHHDTPPSSAKSLAKFLVQDHTLTKFQARSLLLPEQPELRMGDWLVMREQATRPFSSWCGVRHVEDGRTGVLRRLGAEERTADREHWLEAHQQTFADMLLSVECTPGPAGTLVFCPLPRGKLLVDLVRDGGTLPPAKVIDIGVSLAQTLQAMHSQSMIHGGVRLDRIWIGTGYSALLLRDPSVPARNPLNGPEYGWLDSTESPAGYLAPELVDPSRACDAATDIYSLGCLLFRLLTGRSVVRAIDLQEAAHQHASTTPAELTTALEMREKGDPIHRVLAYAMAKTPQARFGSAEQLVAALEAVRPFVDGADPIERTDTPGADVQDLGVQDADVQDLGVQDLGVQDADKQHSDTQRSDTQRSGTSTQPSRTRESERSKGHRTSRKDETASVQSGPRDRKPVDANTPHRSTARKDETTPLDARDASKGSTADRSRPKTDSANQTEQTPRSSTKKRVSKQSTSDEGNELASRRARSVSDRTPSKDRPKSVRERPAAAAHDEAPSAAVEPATAPPVTSPTPPPVSPPLEPPPPESPLPVSPPVATNDASPSPPTDWVMDPDATLVADDAAANDSPNVSLVTDAPTPGSVSSDAVAPGIDSSGLTGTPGSHDASGSNPTQGSTRTPVRRRRKKKDRKAPIVLGGLCVAVLILLVVFLVPRPNEVAETPRRRPPVPTNIPPVTNQPSEDEAEDEAVAGYQLVSDDRLLYVPPYPADAETPPLTLLPPGPAMIVTWKMDALLKEPSGAELVDSMSPDLDNLLQAVATMSNLPLEQVSRCTAALHPGSDGWPEVSLSIELVEPQSRDELIERFEVAESRTSSGAKIYAGDSVDSAAYYLPVSEDGNVTRFAVGSIQRMSEVAETEGGAIPLPRSMQQLWNGASADAEFVALVTPNFLFADGREMLRAALPGLVDPLKATLIPDVAAVMFTLQLGRDQFFMEARMMPSGGSSEAALLRRVEEAVNSWPSWAENFILSSVPDASWRLLSTRLPAMMGFVAEQVRYGIVDGSIVANTYLPANAVPQVSVAVALALNTSSQPMTVAAGPVEAPLTVEQMLDRKMTVSFDQESLEFALEAIVQAFQEELPKGSKMPAAKILGSDLEAGGITQNQQVRDFEKTDVPLRAVLTDLVLGANPDKSATGPKDPKQALLWVIQKNASGESEILITTRKAAVDKYELPKEFVATPSE